MDIALFKQAIEAQFLMHHVPPAVHVAADRITITMYSWEADTVRQQLNVPLTDEFEQQVFELEMQRLASFSFDVAPVTYAEDGTEHEIPGWQDQPRENWGTVGIHPLGVLRLAALYGRPYVRLQESPALLAHWQLVQAESAAREQAPHDQEKWEREWPERAWYWKAWKAQQLAKENDAGG